MLYQNILSEASPYQIRIYSLEEFGEHRHADIELHYCIQGSFDAVINKKRLRIKEGSFLLIHPMSAHSFPSPDFGGNRVLTVILGVSFLKNSFSFFSTSKNGYTIISEGISSKEGDALFALLKETVSFCERGKHEHELLIRGNLYKICAYLINLIKESTPVPKEQGRKMLQVAMVEQALEMIHRDYASPLTVEEAAEATGYGKSNFCKIFKKVTGETFHEALNRRRVENACGLLTETNLPISEIAFQVGFSEPKSFCRVFKSMTSVTPGQYRKNPQNVFFR